MKRWKVLGHLLVSFAGFRGTLGYNRVSFIAKVNGKLNRLMVISVFEIEYCPTSLSFAVSKSLDIAGELQDLFHAGRVPTKTLSA